MEGKQEKREAEKQLSENRVDACSLYFDSLKRVDASLCVMDQELVKVILNCRQNTPDSFELGKDYFQNTLNFFADLKKCLVKAGDSQLNLQVALQCFRNDDREHASTNKYERTLEELKRFKETCNPFNDEFFQTFNAVYDQQQRMIEELNRQKLKLNKRLKKLKKFGWISRIIYALAYPAVAVCSAVGGHPAVSAALSAAVPIMGNWFDSLSGRYENTLKSQRDAVVSLHAETSVVIKDLDHVRVLIESFKGRTEALLQSAELAIKEEGGAKSKVCLSCGTIIEPKGATASPKKFQISNSLIDF